MSKVKMWLVMTVAAAVMNAGGAQAAEMFYSDRELMTATQIAYYDFSREQLADHGGRATVRELLQEGGRLRNLQSAWNNAEEGLAKTMAKRNLELYEEMVSSDSVCGSWYVVDVNDRNEEDGFYAVLIETNADQAIVAFRGSESYDSNQLVKDWINADFGLLMDQDTTQQKQAEAYMADIEKQFSYANYAVTGHSLGGNLAVHAAIAAPDAMKEKLMETVNFDGPGFSEAYLSRHQEEISQVGHQIRLYRWSLVGALLTQPQCVTSRIVQVTEDIKPLEEVRSNYLRHSTAFIDFRDGMVQDGTESLLSMSMGVWSRKVDQQIMEKRKNLETEKSSKANAG
ncbi:MAG: DUF2974 domain-containing protein [Lachnospiraceae bacterium]|nr:DUF2974 domain-containing protein [Lachnospiraceae bacterium]